MALGESRYTKKPLLSLLLLNVCMLEVMRKQNEESYCVTSDEISELVGIITIDEKQLESMQHDHEKLYHLNGGEMSLPPEKFLVLRTESRKEVIAVHNDMDECIDHAEKR